MKLHLTTFLYGPQTAGKTTRLLHLIQQDRGADLAFSGENSHVISNGRLMVKVTAPLPKTWHKKAKLHFMRKIRAASQDSHQLQHLLVDGVQFLSINYVKELYRILRQVSPPTPIVFSGCLYYLGINNQMIPVSQFLLHHCDQVKPVNRCCEFCHRRACRLWGKQIRERKNHYSSIVADPHLVCLHHYQWLNQKNNYYVKNKNKRSARYGFKT